MLNKNRDPPKQVNTNIRLLSNYILAYTFAYTAPMCPVRAFTRMGAWARVRCTWYRTTVTHFAKISEKNENGEKQRLIGEKRQLRFCSLRRQKHSLKRALQVRMPVCAVCTNMYFDTSCTVRTVRIYHIEISNRSKLCPRCTENLISVPSWQWCGGTIISDR